ncbi:mucin-2-like [Mytilus californianus]|uniref:mucin-2-like n=1 Tax=Mytilus californianus TaxID=6549 RepID=UPI002247C698|nr:mucin-2-like [Mytilus californianus]
MCDKALGMSDDSIDGTVSYSSFTINSGKGGLENPWLPESGKFIGSFIQVDFQRVGFFTKIEIKGGMINERTGYVKDVRVEILKEKNNNDSWKEVGTFKANTDVNTTDILSFNMTIGYAIRLQPITWKDYPIIGFEVFGCLPSTPTTGTQAGAPGTSAPLIQTTQPSVTTGPASTTAGLEKCPDDTPNGPLNFETVTSSSNPDGAENALTPSGWKPSAEDEKPVLELSTSDSNPIMNVALVTQFADSIDVKLYNDNVLVYEETVKAQPNGIVELEFIKPLLADKITLTIIPDQTPNATPVVKSVIVEACIKAVTTGQPATTPTSSPVITSGTPSTASTPTTGTQAGAPGTSPPLIQTTQPSVTTGPASTTAGLGKCPDDTPNGPLKFETVTSSSNPDGAENALTPLGWKPSAEDEKPVLELSTSDSNPIMNVALVTQFVDSIDVKLYNDNVLVYEETVKAQPNGIAELEFIKPQLADKITLTIIPDQTPNATPVVKSVTVEACIKALTTGQPATTPTSSPVITSGTPSTASTPTTGTQAGAPGTSPPLIQTTQPSVTTGPASTTAGLEKCPDDTPKGPLNFETVTSSSNPDGAENALTPSGWKPSAEDEKPVLELSTSDSNPIMNVALKTEFVDSIVVKLYNDNVLVYEETVKAQPNGIVELEFIKPQLADKITLTIIPDQTPNATPVVKSVTVEACIKALTTGQPATTPTSSPVITSGTPSTASTPTTGTQAGAPGTSPPLIQTTQPSVTTGSASTTADGAENALTPSGWKPSAEDEKPVLELSTSDSNPIMNVALKTESVDSIVVKLYNDNVLVYEETVKAQPNGIVELEFIKPQLADKITLTIIPDQTPNATPVVKSVTVEACIKALTTGQPATTPTSSPVITSGTPSTASTPTTGTQAGAPGTSPPLIQTTQPSVTTGPASTTADGAENALTPSGWKPSAEDEKPVLELSTSDSNPIMNVALKTESVDSIVVKLYNDNVLVYEETVKAQPNGIVELEFIKPQLADKITLTIIPDQTPNATPVVKSVTVEACIKALTTGQPATTPTSSPVITSGTPSTASTPTTGTQAGAPGTSPPLIQTTQPSVTTGPASTTADGAENALTPSGWKPSAEDEKPVLELSTSDSNPIMNVALKTESVDSIVVKLYNDNVLVYEETVKAQPNGIVELEFIKPQLADKITLTIIPDQTPNATPVVKSVTVEACIKALTTGQPATTPTSSPVITSGTPSTASTPTTGTQAGAPGTSPPLIQTTQPSVTTGPASTTADGAENALTPSGWKPSAEDEKPVLELSTSDSNPIMNVALKTESVDSIVVKLYNDNVLVYEETVKAQPNGIVELEFIKPQLADKITLTIIPDQTPNATPVVKSVTVEACIKALTTGQPATTPTSSPVITSGTPSTASTPTTGTQAGAPGTSPPLIQTTQPSVTTGPASTTADGAENALTPSGWKPSAEDEKPVLELSTSDSNPIMNVALKTESVDSIVVKLYNDNVLVYEETVKAQPNGIVELEFIKPQLADKITLTIIPDQTPNATPVVKSVTVEACIKALTTGQPATTPTSSPVITSGTPSTASTPTTGTQAGAPGTSPPLIQTTQPSVTTGPASTTADGAENALTPSGWKPSAEDEKPVLELSTSDSNPIMNVALKTESVDSIVVKLYNDNVLVYEETVKAQPNGIVELEFIKPQLADKITLTIIPDQTPNATPVVKSVTVEACIKALTTGQPATTPTSSPVITSGTPSTASTPTTGTQAGAPGTSPPLIQTTQPSVTTGPASTTADGAENALTPSGWKPSAEDEKPVLELSTSDSNPIMNVALKTESVDSIVVKLYNDNVLVYEETVKAQPNGIVELEFIKPQLADKITLTIIPDQTPNATPVVKSVTVEACIKALTTGQPATTPTSSPVITSGTPSTASTPTTGTQAGAPGTSPPLIQTTQPSVTTGPASTTADGAENALTPSGWKPSAEDEKPVLELSTSDSNPIMNVALKTESVDSIVVKLYNDNVLVYEETVKAQPNGIVELEFIKPQLADKITLTIIPDQTPNATPVVKSVTVEACIKALTTGQPATTPTSSPVITSGTPSTASTPTTGTQAGAPGTSPPLIQTTQPSVTTGPASTTADGAENALTPSGWKPSAEDEKPVLELSTSDSNPIMNVALKTESVDSIVVKLYNDNVLVYEETVKAQPNGIVELEFIKPQLADKITLTIIPDQTPNATPVVKSVTVEACIKALTTGQPATTPTSSPVITSGTPSTASTPTTGTQAGAPGTSPPLIQTTQPSVTTGPASTTADGAENALTPSGWKPSAEDEKPVLELSTSDSNPIMNVALKTESVDSIVVKLYNDNVLVYEETVKAQPNGIVELEFIKPQLADKITLTIIPDQTPNATPVVKSVTVEACIKALTTGQPATTPTSSPVITSGTPSTASTPTTGTQAGAPGTSPPLIQTTQPSVTTGPASTTADGAENALTPSGWKPSAEDEKPVLELSTSDSNPIMNVALKTESVDSIVVKLYNDNVLVYEETVKAQPNGIVELEFIKPQLADKITLTIIPDQTPNATPVVKSVTVEACIKALTTGQPATTPTSSPVITSGTPSTASTPTTGTQAGAPGTSPPLIQTTQPSVTTGPASTTADGAENALTPSGWKPSAEDEKPVLELSTSDSNPIMNVALKTESVDSIVVKLYNDNVLVYEETVKAQPNGIVELEFIKPQLADKITLTIIPDQTPNATPVVKSVIVEACIKALTTGQPATTPTSSPVITSGTPSTASTPTTGTQAGAPGTSPPLIQTTQPSVTTGPASTTADGAENALTPSGWKPSAEDEKPVLELSTSDSNPIMNVALKTESVDSIVVKLYNDNVLVYEETVKAQPNGIVELEFIKPQLADKITLTIIPDQTPNATPVVKSVTVEACIKALTTGQPATTPTSSPVITSGTPSTASTPTTGTQAGAPGTSPPLIQTTQPSVTTGPASTTADGAENALTPSGWKPSAEDEKPVLELSTSDSNPIMNVALKTESVDSIVVKLYNDNVLVYEETVKAQPNGIVELEFIKPQLADKITLTIIPDQTPNATPVVKSVTVEACIKALTTGQPATTPTSSPVITSGTPSTASTPTTGTQAGAPGTSPPLIQTTQPSVTTGPASTTADGAENALTPSGWKPSAEDEKPVLELSTSDSNPIMNVALKTESVDSIVVKLYNDNVLVYEETVKAQPNGIVELEFIKPQLADKITLTIIPDQTPNATPVVKSVTVEACIKALTTGQPATTPTSSPVITSGTPSTASTPTTGTQAGAPGTSPPLIQTTQPSVTTGPASTTADGAENALTPSGWKPSAEDEKPVLELSTSDSNPIMNVALKTESVDSIVVKLYNDNVLVYEETVKAQPNGIVELEFIKPQLADKITLTIIPDQTPNATPVVKTVTVEACIKALTTGQPATTPTSSPVITSGTPSTASTPTTGTQAGAPGTSPPLIQTTQPSVTTGPASTTADGAENALTPSGWKPSAEDEKPVLELSTSDSNPIMNVALKTESVDSIVVKLYNDNVLVYEETVKAQPNGIVELEFIKPQLADKITLTIIPDQTPNATPVVKSVTVEACIKAVTTGQPATTPTSSPVITSGTPSTASTPTTGTQAGAPGTSPPLIQTTQPSVTTGPASTTAGIF